MQSPGHVGDTFSFGDKFVHTRGVDAMLAKFFSELRLGDIVGHQGLPTKFFLVPPARMVERCEEQCASNHVRP